MRFETPLVPATLIRRYKRFLADVRFADGAEAVAHCANSGSMMGLARPGARVWLSANTNPKAKLAWRWELEEAEGGALVGINTSRPNAIVAEAIAAGAVPALAGYESLRREVAYGVNSRIDVLLERPTGRCFVEVKNVTLKRRDRAEFPDAVTARGAKHLHELINEVKAGHRAVMLFLVNRGDCASFAPAADIDPAYAQALRDATAAGVQCLAYGCNVSPAGISLANPLPHHK
jgi:sugar fermentation stimulation protein A